MRRTPALVLTLGLLVAVVLPAGMLWMLDRLLPPDLSRLHASALILNDRTGARLDGRTSVDGMWRLPLAAPQVDPVYLQMLLRTEDRRFYWHPGVDPLSMARALAQLVMRGHIVSGGSTLAMQASRLLSPHRHSLRGKLLDMARAVQLEWRYGRRGVLDIYLTLTPEGGNIEGVRAGSLLYFGHEPDHLAPQEAALLVAIPRHPTTLRPGRHNALALAAARQVLRGTGMGQEMENVPSGPVPMPHAAPALLAHAWSVGLRDVVRTTLDGRLQRMLRGVVAARDAPLRGTFAALVVRRDGGIAAWIGGGEHQCPGCAVDLVTARRSPGSTLKPFIYGMAFDHGLLTPRTRISDGRMSLSGYAPHDFDQSFRGETTVADALRQSLNVPAVQALRLIGPDRFLSRLAACGVVPRLPGRDVAPGLAIALGGEGISIYDLATLYSALNHDGQVMAPYFDVTGRAPATRLLGPRAAQDVRTILEGTPPPPGSGQWNHVAFKTGTSYGMHDAWAAGVTGQWTIIVWAGRPDGTAAPGITGRATAAPLLAHIVSLLEPDGSIAASGVTPHHQAISYLSPALRRLSRPEGPQIIMPQAGSEMESRADDGTMTPIGLEAGGGTPPYQWMVNGTRLDVPPGAAPSWLPDGVGYVHISVMDMHGRSAAVDVRIR
ncbi:penicillin-binding protein 1C [Komagataeibacter melaceti]|uniref:peptidoglycan glycosyltransferase n=1 Tax=Komagataeibacter melaceti TaxID=2766577 RepID=A0A371YZK1_9PROT|nr:transglycosylase domain-containing protein [Komagataeibacter melaceti]RFD19671.1 penicillin-binding protein 1C [Komagataeibacter melaceti]